MNQLLRADVVETTAALDGLRADWEALYEQATGGTNPFLRWIWVRHWWVSVSRRPGFPRTQLHVVAMRDAYGHLRGIAPFFLGTWQLAPFRFRVLRLYGLHTTLTDIRTVLLAPGWEASAAQTLAATLQSCARQYDVCIVDGLERESDFARSMAVNLSARGRRGPELLAYVLPLPPSWEELRSRLTRNNRGSIQQGYNTLKRDGRRCSFEVIAEPTELRLALLELFDLHAARAASKGGPRHYNYYASKYDRAFVSDLAHDLSPQGLLRVCRLRVDGTVVASRAVLSAGPGLYLYHAGHDPAWDRYRVGTILTAECIQMAIREQSHFVHLGTGTDPSKLRWSPEVHSFDQLHVAAPTPVGEVLSDAAWRVAAAARRIRERWPHRRWLALGGF